MAKIYDFPFRQVIQNRSPIEKELPAEYRNFLEMKYLNGDVWALLVRLSARGQKAALDNLVDRVIQEQGDGKKDREFLCWMGLPYNV